MEYALWIIPLIMVVIIVKQYRGAKAKHHAAANTVFAKYTFGTLSSEDQKRVEEKAAELTSLETSDEIERFGWYAVAMNALKIPSAVPDNPNWYQTKTPDVLYPTDIMLKAIIAFIDRHYDIQIEIAGVTVKSKKKEEELIHPEQTKQAE